MSEYIYRITVFSPVDMLYQANQLALCVGVSPADVNTFKGANFEDADGNEYSVISAIMKASLMDQLSKPVTAPDFAPDADVIAANEALSTAVIYTGQGTPPAPITTALTGYISSAQEGVSQMHIEWSGLSRIVNDEMP